MLVLPTCLPVVCNEFLWAVGMAMNKVAFAGKGVDAVAVVGVNESIPNLFCILRHPAVELCSICLVGVPMVFLGIVVFRLPLWLVYALVHLEEVAETNNELFRLKSGRWLEKLTELKE